MLKEIKDNEKLKKEIKKRKQKYKTYCNVEMYGKSIWGKEIKNENKYDI